MKISNTTRVLSLVGYVIGIVMSAGLGVTYWQGMVVGALFGIWFLLIGAE